MTRHRLRAVLAAGVSMLTLATTSIPAHAQWIVYDPTNFSQNVLTAARELQQVNQNIQSLENSALISSSQSASGALQAAQSGNQIMGLAAQQLADLTGVIAAMARAQSLDNAGRLESEAQGQQQMQNFLNYGAGYQPGNAQMFH